MIGKLCHSIHRRAAEFVNCGLYPGYVDRQVKGLLAEDTQTGLAMLAEGLQDELDALDASEVTHK